MHRICYLGLGHICVVLAVIGAILPGMPTTVFLILATWAYGKSSIRFQQAIYNHRIYGPIVRNWETHGVIPLHAKILAGVMMLLSVAVVFYKAHHFFWPGVLAATLFLVYMYILSRPSKAAQ